MTRVGSINAFPVLFSPFFRRCTFTPHLFKELHDMFLFQKYFVAAFLIYFFESPFYSLGKLFLIIMVALKPAQVIIMSLLRSFWLILPVIADVFNNFRFQFHIFVTLFFSPYFNLRFFLRFFIINFDFLFYIPLLFWVVKTYFCDTIDGFAWFDICPFSQL